MKRLLLWSAVLALALSPLRALAQDPSIEALKGRFTPQEQILLSGLLAEPGRAQEFVRDGAGDPKEFQTKWRARLARFATDYLAKEHPLNEKAPSLKAAAEPAQWAMLMATLRALKSSSSWTDQAKLKIFLGMIEDADDGLKAGDPRAARKVESTADPKLADAMRQYLGSAAARQAVSDEAKVEEAERALAARDQAARDQAARDQAARDQAAKDQAAKDQAARERAAKPQAPAKQPPVAQTPPAQRDTRRGAQDQLEDADRAGRQGDAGRVLDGDVRRGALPGDAPPVQETPSQGGGGGGGGAPSTGLVLPGRTPSLTVKPGVPSPSVKDDDDMAELRSMKKEAQGKGAWRKYAAGGAGALLGGLLGFFLGGPIGAAVGAALGGAGAFFGAKYLWG